MSSNSLYASLCGHSPPILALGSTLHNVYPPVNMILFADIDFCPGHWSMEQWCLEHPAPHLGLNKWIRLALTDMNRNILPFLLVHISVIWIYVMSCVHLSILRGKDFNVGHFMQAAMANLFISAKLIGIIDFHHFRPL